MTIVERRFPEGEQFLFVTAVDGKRIDVRFIDPDEEEAPEAAPAPGHEPTAAALALAPRADDDARAFLRAELERVGERLDPWLLEKDSALMATTVDGFWDAPDRDVLATVEHLDRLKAAYDTAQRLADRLERTSGSRGGEVVRLLAERLYLLDAAVGALDGRAPADAFVRVTSSTASPRAEAAAFATAVAQMYRDWAAQRGMRLHEVDVGEGAILAIAGLGAHAILAPEEGLHVLELPVASEGRSFERVVVHVSVAPWPAAVQVDEIGRVVEGAFRDETGEIRVARRYRHEPSPLVRDHRGWRTGRIDDVLGGRFDLLAAAAAASEG
jgi:ATP-dependent Clp protease ATP-binding subunit ClpC